MIKPFMPERVIPEAPAALRRADIKVVRALVRAAAFGLVGALLVPLPVAAAPALCEQPERYAAQSGAQLMKIGKLDLEPAGRRDELITDIGVGDVKSALAAQSSPSAAAVGRILNAGKTAREAITDVLRQTAPPTNTDPVRRSSKATEAGPFNLGRGELTMHAQWKDGMACGKATGEATRGQAGLRRIAVLEDGDTSLVRVPRRMSSLSTTAMQRSGAGARMIAEATMTGDSVELLSGAVTIKIAKPPTLMAGMSDKDGGEIRYVPAVIEVSGEGFESARLNTAGDAVEFNLDKDGTPLENRADAAKPQPSDAGADKTGIGAGETELGRAGAGDVGSELLDRLPKVRPLEAGPPLPVPVVPGVPPVAERDTEASPAGGPGTTIRVSLGEVRQASTGHAIAAKATAISIAITQGPEEDADTDATSNKIVLDLGMGLLEVAAVAPEPPDAGPSKVDDSGGGGGLPITGPGVDVIALSGIALLIAGAAALIFGMRGRYRR